MLQKGLTRTDTYSLLEDHKEKQATSDYELRQGEIDELHKKILGICIEIDAEGYKAYLKNTYFTYTGIVLSKSAIPYIF